MPRPGEQRRRARGRAARPSPAQAARRSLPSTLPPAAGHQGSAPNRARPASSSARGGGQVRRVHQQAARVVPVAEAGRLAGAVQAGGQRVRPCGSAPSPPRGPAAPPCGRPAPRPAASPPRTGGRRWPARGSSRRRAFAPRPARRAGAGGRRPRLRDSANQGKASGGGGQPGPLRDQVVVGGRAGAVERAQVAAVAVRAVRWNAGFSSNSAGVPGQSASRARIQVQASRRSPTSMPLTQWTPCRNGFCSHHERSWRAARAAKRSSPVQPPGACQQGEWPGGATAPRRT